ncbi:MAG: UDP-2,3-diacylglucosamine diphosphatase LpxI [Nitrospinota bacterium]|nr:UDP-2,3-diacylglucosamine diphosphatase LpxI [Nitrospinota bacterium]
MGAPLGLIAGKGELPVIAMRLQAANQRPVAVITFDKESYERLRAEQTDLAQISLLGLGQASKVIAFLKKTGVREVAFAGKVDKRVIYENPRFDLRALAILKRAKIKNDDSIMKSIVEELEKEGMIVASQLDLFRSLTPGPGLLAKRRPKQKELADMAFGMEMAKGIAALDIGQTVVIKNGAVTAAEAIEGTDEAIARGGKIARGGAVVCKVSKPSQDPRFDVPTVGRDTVEAMIKAGADALAIEADMTMVVGLEETVRLCNENKIAFLAI